MADYALPSSWAPQQEPAPQGQMMQTAAPGQPQQQAPNAFAGVRPQLHITVKDQSGEEHTFDEAHLMNDIAQNGANPTGISADGLHITFQGAKGPYQASVTDVLAKMGYNSVGIKPIDADDAHVNPAWRAQITNLDDDDAKQAFLTAKLKREGEADPKVYGSGRDWYAYSPNLGKWLALTNGKGWGLGDVAEGALKGTRMVGSAVGAGVGGAMGAAAGGIGAIPGSMAGAALAGGGIDAIEKGINAFADEDFRNSEGLGAHVANIGLGAALDAGTAGTFGSIGKYGAPALKNLVQNGLASSAARGVGGTLNAGGKLAADAAGGLNSTPFGRDVAAAFIPGASQMQNAGFLMQAPSQILTGGASALKGMGESGLVKNIIGEDAASALAGSGKSLLQNRVPTSATDKFGNLMREGMHGAESATTRPVTATDVTTNLGENVGKFFTKEPGVVSREAYEAARATAGASEDAADKQAFEEFINATKHRGAAQTTGADIGRKAGQYIEGADKIGEALNSGARGISAGALYGIQGLGKAAQYGGGALSTAGKLAAPLENYLLTRGAEDATIHDNIMNRLGPRADKLFNHNRRPNPVRQAAPMTYAQQGDY